MIVSSLYYPYVTMAYCWRRIRDILFVLPMLIMIIIIPIILHIIILPFIDYVSCQYSILCLLLTYIGTNYINQYIYNIIFHQKHSHPKPVISTSNDTQIITTNTTTAATATTITTNNDNDIIMNNNNNNTSHQEHLSNNRNDNDESTIKMKRYNDKIENYRIRIILFVFIISCCICYFIINPLMIRFFVSSSSSLNNIKTWLSLTHYTPSLQPSLYICIIMILLSFLIVTRYVARTSIMRCSLVPLRTNPWYAKLRYICQYPGMCLQPGDYPGELLFSFRINNQNNNNNRYSSSIPRRSYQGSSPSSSPKAVSTTTTQNGTTTTNTKVSPSMPLSSTSSSANDKTSTQQQDHSTTPNPNNNNMNNIQRYDTNQNQVTIHEELLGRRYQRPSILNMLAQILYSFMIGWIVSYVIIHQDNNNNDASRTMIRTVCCLSVIAPILLSFLGWGNSNRNHNMKQSSHEIDVAIYLYPFSYITEWISIIRNRTIIIVISAIIFPFLGIYVVHYFQQTNVLMMISFLRMENIQLILYSFFISTYLYSMDEIMKLYVIHCFTNDGQMKQIIDNVEFDRTYQKTLDVILHSLLQNDPNLVSDILRMIDQDRYEQDNMLQQLTNTPSGRAREEIDKCYPLIQQMAQILLLSSSMPYKTNDTTTTVTGNHNNIHNTFMKKRGDLSNFEEDVFRLLFLESIGGYGKQNHHDRIQLNGRQKQSNQEQQQQYLPPQFLVLAVSRRHQDEINNWIDITPPPPSKIDSSSTNSNTLSKSAIQHRKDIAISLVRGLSIFIGGYGEALSLCASPVNIVLPSGHYIQSSNHNSIYSWTISSSAIISLQFAVQGVTRCIHRSYHDPISGQIIVDWMNSMLTHNIPAVLTSFFYLRVGIIKYSKYYSQQNPYSNNNMNSLVSAGEDNNNGTLNVNHTIRLYNVDLFKLLQITDASALSILRLIQIHSSHKNDNVHLELDEDVKQWTQRLFVKED